MPTFSRRSLLVFLDQDLYEKCSFVFSFLSLHPERSEPRPAPSEKSLPPAPTQTSQCLPGCEALPWVEQKVDQRVFLWDRKDPAPLNSQPPALERKRVQKEGRRGEAVLRGSFAQGIKEPGFFWKLSTLAKTRWKDQSRLYESAFMVSSSPPV